MSAQPVCYCEVIHGDVVADTRSRMLQEEEYLRLASLYKLFSDGTRVRILHALHQNEMCVCDIACLLGLTKSAVSHQLKALRMANLVKYRRDAQTVYYSLADDHVERIIDMGLEHLRE